MPQLPQYQRPIVYTVPLNLAGPAYASYSASVNAQTCVNWYPVLSGPDSKVQAALFPTHGTTVIGSVGGGSHRGAIEHKGQAYFLSGSSLISMNTSQAFTTLTGATASTTGRVSMASNGDFGDQIIIVDGTAGYRFDGATLAVIADPDFPVNPTSVRYMDAVAIVTVADSGVWYISDTNDFTSWTATRFANAERDPDNLVTIEVNNRDIMLFGEYTTEVGTNTGGFPFPFEVYANGLFDKGCAARFSVTKADDYVYWLSKDRRGAVQILKAKGISYSPVSSMALDQVMSTYATISDAHAFCYSEKGTTFYQITFPSAGVTWVYNTRSPDPEYAWFQKKTGSDRHRASTYVAFNGQQYVGSYSDSLLYKLDATVYKDDTTPIIRERTSSTISSQGSRKRLIHRRLELEFEQGVGLATGQGSNPQIALDWSDDGGPWSNVMTASAGGLGEYSKRVLFNTLGMSRNRIYRIRVSDPINWVLLEGYLDVEETSH